MNQITRKFTEGTLIPVSLVITFIIATIWVAFAIAKIDYVAANDVKQDLKIENQTVLLLDIRDRIIRIEARQPNK